MAELANPFARSLTAARKSHPHLFRRNSATQVGLATADDSFEAVAHAAVAHHEAETLLGSR